MPGGVPEQGGKVAGPKVNEPTAGMEEDPQ